MSQMKKTAAQQFDELMECAANFHDRFKTRQNADQAAAIMREEIEEVVSDVRHNNIEAAELELLDVLFTWYGLVISSDTNIYRVLDRAKEVIDKNNAKAPGDYIRHPNGKIAKKEPRK